ncbi:MAG TPA: TIGR01777 family oxidoreductase [Acidobacteriaceae bacterium]|nr:TIGR01777 family oxidoreductase [Acidobacteriaceae bacterium]
MANPAAMKVLVSGGSGLIGASIVRSLAEDRIDVVQLVRRKATHSNEVEWDPRAGEPVGDWSKMDWPKLEGASAAIHLSGANVAAHRWTAAYKREIADSRVGSTRTLVNLLKKLEKPPGSLLCASAIGIYGDRGDEKLTEASPPGTGFLAETCRAWEAEADAAARAGMRVVHLRTGVVLAREDGALKKMLPLFRAGLGGRLGDGRQWMSWIALSDLVRAVRHILATDSLKGPVNLVGPIPVTNAEFTKALGRAVHRPAVLPTPAFALRAALGEMADAALLASTRVIPVKLAESGFHFDFPEIGGALRSLV